MLAKSFVVVQEMFLTETAALADVVLPAANAYEKEGTITNYLRRRQLARGGRRQRGQARFRDDRSLLPTRWFRTSAIWFPSAVARVPTWDRRAARSRARPTVIAVWLEAHDLEPGLTPLDPIAIPRRDSARGGGIRRSRVINCGQSGNDQHTEIC